MQVSPLHHSIKLNGSGREDRFFGLRVSELNKYVISTGGFAFFANPQWRDLHLGFSESADATDWSHRTPDGDKH